MEGLKRQDSSPAQPWNHWSYPARMSQLTQVPLMWSPWDDNMFAGFEYFYGIREDAAGQTGIDNRLNLVCRYMFHR